MTIHLLQLWLPIILGTGLAWIASGLIHMLLKYHNSDYQQLSNEAEVMTVIKNGSPNLGIHSFPFCSDMGEMGNPEVQQKFSLGPVGMLTLFPDGMPKNGQTNGSADHFFPGWLHIDCLLRHSRVGAGRAFLRGLRNHGSPCR